MRHFKQILIILCFLSSIVILHAQDKYADPDGLSTNTGAINSPWDLQTGLDNITPGNTLWLRGGDYTGVGHYHTNGQHGEDGNPITVSSYPGEWARINGNVICTTQVTNSQGVTTVICEPVLNVTRNYYIFKDFEITMISDDDPNTTDDNFSRSTGNHSNTLPNPYLHPYIGRTGISHTNGINCKFINLIIHNMGGNGIGSWNQTGGAEVYGCLIYNNGNESGTSPGVTVSGSGAYIQNSTDLWKDFENNIFFNNFKVGAKLWSATPDLDPGDPTDFLKHLNFKNNVILNTGSPLNKGKECFILDSANIIDNENVVHDVDVSRNFMYHNSSAINSDLSGSNFEVLKIAVSGDNLAFNINVEDNYFLGGNQGMRFIRIGNNFNFKRNVSKARYIYSMWNSQSDFTTMNPNNWHFGDNTYFSTYNLLYYMFPGGQSTKRTLLQMTTPISSGGEFGIENNTTNPSFRYGPGSFNNFMHNNGNVINNNTNVISITQNEHKPNRFKIVVYHENGDHVKVNLISYNIPQGTPYTIRDAENYFDLVNDPGNPTNIFTSGSIVLPMGLTDLDEPNGHYPGSTNIPRKTDPQVGVFIVEFGDGTCQPDYVLQDETEAGTEEYIAGNSITTAGSSTFYDIEPNADVTHKAGNYILLKDGTHIKNGSKYLAVIEDCDASNFELDYVGETYLNARKSISKNDDKKTSEIKVSPNPTSDYISISSEEGMASLNLSNVFGKVYFDVTLNTKTSNKTDLNLTMIPSGMYFLKIILTTGEVVTKQIVKK